MKKFIKCSVIVSALLMSSAFAAADVNKSDNNIINNKPIIIAQNEVEVSKTATKIMLSIANARGYIAHKNVKKAKESLQKALISINIIDNKKPTSKITNLIDVAKKHLEYEPSKEVKQDLIPIAYNIDELVDVKAVKVAKSHLEKVKEYLGLDKKAKAKKELEATEATVQVNGLYFPINKTKSYIHKALQYLNSKDFTNADATLKKAENSLVVISVIEAGPINNAKKSFSQAIIDYSHGEYSKAKDDLEKSKQWLKQASYSSSKTVRDEANKLLEKTDALKKEISKKNDSIKNKLSALWSESKALAQRENATLGTDYSLLSTKTATQKALLDAKLHLEYAKTKMFISGTNDEVKQELDKSIQDLQKAKKTADTKTKNDIILLEKEVNELKSNISQKNSVMKAKYNKAKTDIEQTIRNIKG